MTAWGDVSMIPAAELAALREEVERLRAARVTVKPLVWRQMNDNPESGWPLPEVRAMREALRPFADFADLIASETEGVAPEDAFLLMLGDTVMDALTLARFQRARAALAALGDAE